MAYSPFKIGYKLSPEGVSGHPNYQKALQDTYANIQGAYDTAYKPKNLSEQLLAAQLANKINKPKAENAQLSFDTDIGYKQALTNQANRPPAITGETAQLFALRDSLPAGADRDKVDQIISLKARGSNGTTVYDPKTGNPLVQIGGAFGKSGGGTFINPETGEATSQPTGSTATNLQQRIVGTETVKPYLNKIVETLPQFQNPLTQASLYGQKLANAFGGQNFPLPSQKASGKAAIKEASEGMLKSFGLNATGANRQAMEDILTPHFGESEQGYRDRVLEQAQAYVQNQQQAKQALTGGINLNQKTQQLNPVPKGKVRVYFPDGPHLIPTKLLDEALKSGATISQELPNV